MRAGGDRARQRLLIDISLVLHGQSCIQQRRTNLGDRRPRPYGGLARLLISCQDTLHILK